VKANDDVLCQSFTFSASANTITYLGAHPVFIDSEQDTLNMDPVLLEEAILDGILKGRKPKAIICVHLYGMPAKMENIVQIARKYDIKLIEDAAEAFGSKVNGIYCGTIGDFGILSFNGNKIITTSGGGALVSKDEEVIVKAKFLSTQAKDQAPYYQHSEIGYNYRLSNICAAIGCGQMKVLPDRVQQRRKNFNLYLSELNSLPGIEFIYEPEGSFSNRWLTTIIITKSAPAGITNGSIQQRLNEYNIESRPLWKPMHLQPVFKNCHVFSNGVASFVFERGLCLPSGSNLSISNLYFITDLIKDLWDT